jgi:hypothetical protein
MRNMTEIVIERTGYDIGAAIKRAKGRPEYHQETILLEVARRISNATEEQDVSRADLARTAFKWRGYRFYFFSREESRPHVPVYCPDGEAKF